MKYLNIWETKLSKARSDAEREYYRQKLGLIPKPSEEENHKKIISDNHNIFNSEPNTDQDQQVNYKDLNLFEITYSEGDKTKVGLTRHDNLKNLTQYYINRNKNTPSQPIPIQIRAVKYENKSIVYL